MSQELNLEPLFKLLQDASEAIAKQNFDLEKFLANYAEIRNRDLLGQVKIILNKESIEPTLLDEQLGFALTKQLRHSHMQALFKIAKVCDRDPNDDDQGLKTLFMIFKELCLRSYSSQLFKNDLDTGKFNEDYVFSRDLLNQFDDIAISYADEGEIQAIANGVKDVLYDLPLAKLTINQLTALKNNTHRSFNTEKLIDLIFAQHFVEKIGMKGPAEQIIKKISEKRSKTNQTVTGLEKLIKKNNNQINSYIMFDFISILIKNDIKFNMQSDCDDIANAISLVVNKIGIDAETVNRLTQAIQSKNGIYNLSFHDLILLQGIGQYAKEGRNLLISKLLRFDKVKYTEVKKQINTIRAKIAKLNVERRPITKQIKIAQIQKQFLEEDINKLTNLMHDISNGHNIDVKTALKAITGRQKTYIIEAKSLYNEYKKADDVLTSAIQTIDRQVDKEFYKDESAQKELIHFNTSLTIAKKEMEILQGEIADQLYYSNPIQPEKMAIRLQETSRYLKFAEKDSDFTHNPVIFYLNKCYQRLQDVGAKIVRLLPASLQPAGQQQGRQQHPVKIGLFNFRKKVIQRIQNTTQSLFVKFRI